MSLLSSKVARFRGQKKKEWGFSKMAGRDLPPIYRGVSLWVSRNVDQREEQRLIPETRNDCWEEEISEGHDRCRMPLINWAPISKSKFLTKKYWFMFIMLYGTLEQFITLTLENGWAGRKANMGLKKRWSVVRNSSFHVCARCIFLLLYFIRTI